MNLQTKQVATRADVSPATKATSQSPGSKVALTFGTKALTVIGSKAKLS